MKQPAFQREHSRYRNPLSMILHLLRTGERSAYFAMASSAVAWALTPLDFILQRSERRLYNQAPARAGPLIFIVGAPRSGTTLCEQIVLKALPVAYLNNVTSLFPRSPLMGCRWFGRPRPYRSDLENYYGKTFGLQGPNDALYIWDRWLGRERWRIPEVISNENAAAMRQFFAACEFEFGRPLVNKCNSLIASAHLVNEALENCYFLCLARDDLFLAQSLYRARNELMAHLSVPYGLRHDSFMGIDDACESVCRQVQFYKRLAETQVARIGEDHFWIVDYEADLCRQPQALVDRIGEEILGIEAKQVRKVVPITVRNHQRVDNETFQRLKQHLDILNKQVDSSR